MRHLTTLFTLLVLLLAAPAWAADVGAAGTQAANGCIKYKLCDDETDASATNACQTDGKNIIAYLAGRYAMTLYATSSDSTTAFSCHLYSSDNGWSATKRQQITTTALSTSQYAVSIDGALEDVWMVCTGTLTNGVTINALTCPLSR